MAYLWLKRALRLAPDMIVVADITMPVMHGIGPAGKLYKSGSNSKLVFLPHSKEELARVCLAEGAPWIRLEILYESQRFTQHSGANRTFLR